MAQKTTIRPNKPDHRFNIESDKVKYLTKAEMEALIGDYETHNKLYKYATVYLNKRYKIIDIPFLAEYICGYHYYKISKLGGELSVIKNPKPPVDDESDEESDEKSEDEPVPEPVPEPPKKTEEEIEFHKYHDKNFKDYYHNMYPINKSYKYIMDNFKKQFKHDVYGID
jgi:hypothetical protein